MHATHNMYVDAFLAEANHDDHTLITRYTKECVGQCGLAGRTRQLAKFGGENIYIGPSFVRKKYMGDTKTLQLALCASV
jgi:hypothetical protein